MKKWIIYTILIVFAATSASAQWWKLGLGDEESEQPQQQQMRRGSQPGQRPKMSDEKQAEMKAEREATHKLADAARNEADPVKKAALVDQLRAKVTEGAEKRNAEFSKRLEKAEQGVTKMKERLAKAEKEKEQKIEEHIQKLLSGEKPQHPEGKRSGKKGPSPVE